MISSARRIRAIATSCGLLIAVLLAAGCSSWKEAHGTVPSVLGEEPHERILVKLTDGTKVVVRNPKVREDSLFGTLEYRVLPEGERFTTSVVREGALALADIEVVEVRKGDAVKAFGLGVGVLGVIALAGFIALAITFSNMAD